MTYDDFLRAVTVPYWCTGSPLAWECAKDATGIAHLARAGKVGQFNLSWWMLRYTSPPFEASVYRHAPLSWPVLVAPRVMLRGRSLTDYAALLNRSAFEALLLSNAQTLRPQIIPFQGVTWNLLVSLTQAKHADSS